MEATCWDVMLGILQVWLCVLMGFIMFPAMFGVSLGFTDVYIKVLVKILEVKLSTSRGWTNWVICVYNMLLFLSRSNITLDLLVQPKKNVHTIPFTPDALFYPLQPGHAGWLMLACMSISAKIFTKNKYLKSQYKLQMISMQNDKSLEKCKFS